MKNSLGRVSHVSSYAAMSVEEIAHHLGLSARTIRKTLNRALQKLGRKRDFVAVLQEAAEVAQMKRDRHFETDEDGEDEQDG